MNVIFKTIANLLINNGLIAAFLFVGLILLFANFLSEKLTHGRVHSSAIAIFFGLILGAIGGALTGGEKGISDIAIFSGMGILGGSTLRDFTIIASSYGAKLSEVKKFGILGIIALFVGISSAYFVGMIVSIMFGYQDIVSIATIASGAVTFIVGPVTGYSLGASSEVIALSITVGLVKTIFIMLFTPVIAKKIGLTTPKMAMIYGGLVGSTSGISAGLAATDASFVPYGTMVATFYSGLGCLLCPSLLYAITKLII